MTICIGFIPNDKTVMLIQDSEITYQQLGFTQDIVDKIKKIDDNSIVGVIGDPRIANEILEQLRSKNYNSSSDLREKIEETYHKVRETKLFNFVLRKYGLSHTRDVVLLSKDAQVDSVVREEILKITNDYEGRFFSLSLMLATNIERPQLYTVVFPGVGTLEDNVKMYSAAGSGAIMAIDKMGEELERYKWQPELSIDEGIEVLMRAGKASEKQVGVGGPFDITYITRDKEGKNQIVKPNQRKINMVMYLFPFSIDEGVRREAINLMRHEEVSYQQLAQYIKGNTGVGIEFDHYFKL